MSDSYDDFFKGMTQHPTVTTPPTGKPADESDFGLCVRGRSSKQYNAVAIFRNGERVRVFEYMGKAITYEGDNERLDLIFKEPEATWVVTVRGLRLLQALMAFKENKIDSMHEAPGNSRNFDCPDEWLPIIRAIEIKEKKLPTLH